MFSQPFLSHLLIILSDRTSLMDINNLFFGLITRTMNAACDCTIRIRDYWPFCVVNRRFVMDWEGNDVVNLKIDRSSQAETIYKDVLILRTTGRTK